MRATRLTVTALAAALLLTACSDGGDDSKGNSTKAKDSNACDLGGIGIEVGPASAAPAAGDTGNIPVSLTNQSEPCTLEGFPAVQLDGGDASVKVAAEQGGQAPKLSLPKGASASFTITYVRGAAGDGKSLDARTLKVSLPGGPDSKTFPWTYGPVAGKGGDKSAPEATVSAFQQAGD
ncbi:DUF4232 domain-containing protein [Streptomyces sp. TRM68367]|uniref:DUF4232 domain-containing protein n=1 Tax=Streptomyces sp. TRM68367 TaxID=2758415 RepID=UPI00165B05DE|nr:DUF4232 domain-containing protein [Streptomyces sp. TRM68367]MBC9726750.1 DUF4232 domain-containing protein [Streptomyces sp. TRM68367]